MSESAAIDPTGEALYLDDLAPGRRFTSAIHALDARQIKAFAAAFDPQRFHLDEAAARDTLFGGLAASGWHMAAITMKLLVGGGAPPAGGIIGGGGEISGRGRRDPATCCGSRARSWRLSRRARSRIAAWSG